MKIRNILLTLLVSGCSVNTKQVENSNTQTIIPISHEYREISDYELNQETIFDVDEDFYYVYFYSTTCNHCEELKDYIIGKALERGDIYFVKGSSKDHITNDPKKTIGAEKPEDIWILGYPSLLQISNHKCTKNLAGTSQIKEELK